MGSATRARYYGAAYVLAAPGSVPRGTKFVAKLGRAARRDALALPGPGSRAVQLRPRSSARVVSATQTGNATWRLDVQVRLAPR